jgi:Family of unknown function (DUF6220)
MGRVVVTRMFQGVAWLVVAGLGIEFYLAGAALFGVTTFQWHRLLGVVLAAAIVLLLALGAVASPGRRSLGPIALLVVLTLVQASLPRLQTVVPWLAALHVVNAAILLGLAGPIARSAGRLSVQSSSHEALAPVGSRG